MRDIINTIDSAVERLWGQASELGSNVAILQERLNYTDNQVNNLISGSDKLTLADLNEEAASLVAADTRINLEQLGIGIAAGNHDPSCSYWGKDRSLNTLRDYLIKGWGYFSGLSHLICINQSSLNPKKLSSGFKSCRKLQYIFV